MKTETREFQIKIPTIEGDCVAEVITLEVPVAWDGEIAEWVLTEEAHRLIEDTKARHMGLLLPHQFLQLRQRHALTQSEIGELFQVGAKSWTRWETGKHRPSRSVNLLIKALFDNQITIEYLRQSSGDQSD
jgi:DNA-binding transcriptional regulator YiaG